jgi:hypothetical protein
MKKLVLLNVILMTLRGLLLAQEIPCYVLERSPYYSWDGIHRYVADLEKDDVVFSENICGITQLTDSALYTLNIWFTKENNSYGTYAKNLIPINTEVLFDYDITINYAPTSDTTKEMWVPSYYCEVLQTKNRETLAKFEPHLSDYNTNKPSIYNEKPMHWSFLEYTHIESGMYLFYNAIIYAGYLNSFLIKNIAKSKYGYIVTCFGPKEVKTNVGPSFDWSQYPGDEINLLLYIDDKYLDIYINDISHKFGTLVRVNEEFINQYESLIKTGNCDLTSVIWPCRADGSMDYPSPQLAQVVPEQPETVAVDVPSARDEDTAAVTLERETVAQDPGIGLPLVIVLAVAGIAVAAGVVVFLIRRKR